MEPPSNKGEDQYTDLLQQQQALRARIPLILGAAFAVLGLIGLGYGAIRILTGGQPFEQLLGMAAVGLVMLLAGGIILFNSRFSVQGYSSLDDWLSDRVPRVLGGKSSEQLQKHRRHSRRRRPRKRS